MTEKKSSESRRKLLKSIAAGGGAIVAGKSLPDKWTAPVVDSVLLPAHAQTSPTPTTTAAPITTNYYCYIDAGGWGYSVAVTGDAITFTGHDGALRFEPVDVPKFVFTGSGSTAGGSPVVISVSTNTAANPNCVTGGSFLNPRNVTINLDGNGVPVSMVWPTGDDLIPWDLTPSATPCALPAIATCIAPPD